MMKLNEPLYAIVDAAGEVLGNGECACLSTLPPDPEDIELAELMSKRDDARVVRVRLVLDPTPSERSPELAAALERSRRRNVLETAPTPARP